jgi:AcrR family transcriptional regulator
MDRKPSAPGASGSAVPLGRRERNKLDKQRRIVAAARRLFRSLGYTNTTTQQVAKAAGIATGTLFLYVHSKEDLLVLVFKDEISEAIERLHRSIPAEAPLLEQIEQFFAGFVAYHKRDLDIARALTEELTFLGNPARRRDMAELQLAILGKLAELVEAAQRRGEVRGDAVPIVAAQVLFAIFYQLLHAWLGGYIDEARFRTGMSRGFRLFAEGLGVRRLRTGKNNYSHKSQNGRGSAD